MGSVRGFDGNSLGPRSTPSPQDRFNDPDPIGGNVLIEMSAEILFPLPFVDDQTQMRSVLFFDAGNVFNTNCPQVSVYCLDIDEGELRYSAEAEPPICLKGGRAIAGVFDITRPTAS